MTLGMTACMCLVDESGVFQVLPETYRVMQGAFKHILQCPRVDIKMIGLVLG